MSKVFETPDPVKHSEPQEELVISSLETLKVLSDPLRLQILELMSKPVTVKAVAKALEMPATKLYYHVSQLEEHGLIRVVDTRVVSGIIEKHYRISAKSYKVDRKLLEIDKDDGQGLGEVMHGLMEGVALDIRRAVQAKLIDTAEGGPKHRRLVFGRTIFSLTPAQVEDFSQRLDALLKEFDYDNPDPQAQPYSLFLAFHPHFSPGASQAKQDSQDDHE